MTVPQQPTTTDVVTATALIASEGLDHRVEVSPVMLAHLGPRLDERVVAWTAIPVGEQFALYTRRPSTSTPGAPVKSQARHSDVIAASAATTPAYCGRYSSPHAADQIDLADTLVGPNLTVH